MKGKDVDLSGTLLRVFPTSIHDFFHFFYYLLFTGASRAAQYAASLPPIQYLFLTTLINYYLSKTQVMSKTKRNSSYFSQWDSDEHSAGQHVSFCL